MRTFPGILIVACLVGTGVGAAQAAELFTPSIQSDGSGTGFYCAAVNKSTTGTLTLTLDVIAPFVGSIGACGPVAVLPRRGTACYVDGAGFYAYCKITTSSTANTRASLMVLDANFSPTAAADAK